MGPAAGESPYFLGRKRVTGIYQTGRRKYIKENIEPGQRLGLKRDYGNMYDDNAVEVVDMKGDRIGFIEARANADAAFFIDSGIECYCVVVAADKTAATVGVLVDVYFVSDAVTAAEAAENYRKKMIRESAKNEQKRNG